MLMAAHKTQRRAHGPPMKKTSISMPQIVIDALSRDAERSGFSGWTQQLRYEVMKPRGLWKDIEPVLPTQEAPRKA